MDGEHEARTRSAARGRWQAANLLRLSCVSIEERADGAHHHLTANPGMSDEERWDLFAAVVAPLVGERGGAR